MDGDVLKLYEFQFDDVFPVSDPAKIDEIEFILTLAMIHNDLVQLWMLLKSLTFEDASEAENAYAQSASIYYSRVALFHNTPHPALALEERGGLRTYWDLAAVYVGQGGLSTERQCSQSTPKLEHLAWQRPPIALHCLWEIIWTACETEESRCRGRF